MATLALHGDSNLDERVGLTPSIQFYGIADGAWSPMASSSAFPGVGENTAAICHIIKSMQIADAPIALCGTWRYPSYASKSRILPNASLTDLERAFKPVITSRLRSP